MRSLFVGGTILAGMMVGVGAAAARANAAGVPLADNLARVLTGVSGRVAIAAVSLSGRADAAAIEEIARQLRRRGIDAVPMAQPLGAGAVAGGEAIVEICTRLGALGLVAVRPASTTARAAAAIHAADGRTLGLLLDGEPPVAEGDAGRQLQAIRRDRSNRPVLHPSSDHHGGSRPLSGVGLLAVVVGLGAVPVGALWGFVNSFPSGDCNLFSSGCASEASHDDRPTFLIVAGVATAVIGGVLIYANRPAKAHPSTAGSAFAPTLWALPIATSRGGGAILRARF